MGVDRTDHGLVAAVRAGDDLAFEELYGRYEARIKAYVNGMVRDHARAEDITQDVFVAALRRMRATRGPLAFKAWIYEIAKNASIDAFRRSKRAEVISFDARDEGAERMHLVSSGPTPDAEFETRQTLDHLRGAFVGLSEAHHQILVMRELEGRSYREIGERLELSPASVESTLFRARKRLSEEYEEHASGRRCRRVQSIIAQGTEGNVGVRDERRMARHVSYCQPCRRAALTAGFELAPRPSLRDKIAALLPLPAFLRRRIAGQDAVGGHGGSLAKWSATAAQVASEPSMGGWAKAATAATALVVAGAGAGVVSHVSGADPPPPAAGTAAPARSAAPASHPTTRTTASSPSRQGASPSSAMGSASSSSRRTTGSSPSSGAQGSGGSAASDPGRSTTSGGGGGTTQPAGDAVRRTATSTTDAANRTASGATDAVGKTVAGTTDAAGRTVSGATDAAGKTVGTATGSVGKTVGETTGSAGKAVGDTTGSAGKAVGDTTGSAGKAVGDTTGAVGGAVGGPAGDAAGSAGGAVGGAVGSAGGVVGGAVGSAGGAAGGAVGSAGGAAGGAVGSAGGAAGGAVGSAGGAVGGAVGSAGGAVGGAVGAVTGTSPPPAGAPLGGLGGG